MNTSNRSRSLRRTALPALVGIIATALDACSGGGVTSSGGGGVASASATPYALFASNYVAYSSNTSPYLHSIQDGDLFAGFGGNYNYGCYSSQTPALIATQLYILEAQAAGNGTCQGLEANPQAPTGGGDYVYISIKAPGSNTSGSNTGGAAVIPPLDISQSNNLLIQMGNSAQPTAGAAGSPNVTVFTVEMSNDPAGNVATATAVCDYNQTLATVGTGTAPLGVENYEIPFSSFTCLPGSIETLQSTGITVVAVKIVGTQNPNVVVGEFDNISVGYIGFSK